jgi:hypothetical protein
MKCRFSIVGFKAFEKGDFDMYDYNPPLPALINIEDAYETIAAAAALYSSKGNLDIWIYLVEGKIHCHTCELRVIERFFVAHYRCETLLKGLSNHEWLKLGNKIYEVHSKEN